MPQATVVELHQTPARTAVVVRAARRPRPRVPAATGAGGAVRRTRRRPRSGRGRDRDGAGAGGLRATAGSTADRAAGHPRPRRARGQPAPGRQLERTGRDDRDRLPAGRPSWGWGRRPSGSTVATPAPAAATTGPSGGAEPARSPLLRRPDLLVSLLTYWQHHPALSYAFSGRFVGATSQAPRVDEGRPRPCTSWRSRSPRSSGYGADSTDDDHRPWLVDRALRHLLADLTGNAHRSEFCIDKLYSPDSLRGRLGLLELRGFEMPPHPDLALAQALLIRTVLARCAEEPYRAPLIRWGSRLHEQYLLPHFVRRRPGRRRRRICGAAASSST